VCEDKYSTLIYYNDEDDNNNAFSISPTTSPIAKYYNREYYPSSYTYEGEQQPQQYYLTKDSFKQSCIDMLREEAEKFFTSLEKMLTDEAIDQYVSRTSSSSLPMLPFDDKQQGENSYPS
jgi:hypothetical protein